MANRRGRPKKENVARFECGKIDHRPDPTALEQGEFQRMKDMVKKEALHPSWVCELWRLHHFGKITNELREAGDLWIKLVEEHRKYIDLAPPGAKISRLERGFGTNEIDIDAINEQAKEAYEEWAGRLTQRYDRAFLAVSDRHNGVNIMRAVNAVCLDDEPLDYCRFILAKKGLEILAKHFGLLSRKNG